MHPGFPRKLGDPVISTPLDSRTGPAGRTSPRPVADALWQPRERSARVAGKVVPCSEGNGAGGKDAGSLSPFIVPMESRETDPAEAGE